MNMNIKQFLCLGGGVLVDCDTELHGLINREMQLSYREQCSDCAVLWEFFNFHQFVVRLCHRAILVWDNNKWRASSAYRPDTSRRIDQKAKVAVPRSHWKRTINSLRIMSYNQTHYPTIGKAQDSRKTGRWVEVHCRITYLIGPTRNIRSNSRGMSHASDSITNLMESTIGQKNRSWYNYKHSIEMVIYIHGWCENTKLYLRGKWREQVSWEPRTPTMKCY